MIWFISCIWFIWSIRSIWFIGFTGLRDSSIKQNIVVLLQFQLVLNLRRFFSPDGGLGNGAVFWRCLVMVRQYIRLPGDLLTHACRFQNPQGLFTISDIIHLILPDETDRFFQMSTAEPCHKIKPSPCGLLHRIVIPSFSIFSMKELPDARSSSHSSLV